jgi:hypothetical protein
MLRRIIASILIFALIGHGTSWAFSGHAFDDTDHAVDGVHEHTETALDESGCDHCCDAASKNDGTGSAPAEAFTAACRQLPPRSRPLCRNTLFCPTTEASTLLTG